MKQSNGRGFSATETMVLWDMWQRGESQKAIGEVTVVANEMLVIVGDVVHELTTSHFNAGMSWQLRSSVACILER